MGTTTISTQYVEPVQLPAEDSPIGSGDYGNVPDLSERQNGRVIAAQSCSICDPPHDLDRDAAGRFWCEFQGYGY